MTDPMETFHAEQDLHQIALKAARIGMISQADYDRLIHVALVLGPDEAERVTVIVEQIEFEVREGWPHHDQG